MSSRSADAVERVGGADREAVHRRGGERRHVVGGAGVDRERAAQRVVEEDVLGVEHVGVLEHGGAGFVDRDGHRPEPSAHAAPESMGFPSWPVGNARTMSDELRTTAAALVAEGKGILAADESNGTMDKRLKAAGVEATEEMRRALRELLFTTEGAAEHISGVILYDETFHQSTADGTPFPQLLEAQGVVPGIKVDTGAKPLAGSPEGEKVTEGLDGLRERLADYYEGGARFAKWRAVIAIDGDRLPSDYCLHANAHALGALRGAVPGGGHRADRRARGASWTASTRSTAPRRSRRRRRRRSSPSCASSACCWRGCCSSRTWCSPATSAPSRPPTRRWPSARCAACAATSRRRCRASCSCPAARATRTRRSA